MAREKLGNEGVIRNLTVTAARSICQGYRNCVIKSPEYFGLDDDGLVFIPRPGVDPNELHQSEEINPEDLKQVEEALNSCPVSALVIEESAEV